MVYYHKFLQCSDEWFAFKSGKLSASNATSIGANGAGLKTYCKQVAMQINGIEKEHYTNSDIERGNEQEPLAVSAYEFEKGVKITLIGCVTNDKYNNVLCSPDGLIDLDGGCEIKARNDEKHYSLIQGETKEIPFNQIQMTLLITERKWWDFISINPNLKKSLFIKRIYPDLEYFKKLENGFIEGNKLVKKYVETYNNYQIK